MTRRLGVQLLAWAMVSVACQGAAPGAPDAGAVPLDPERCSVPGGCEDQGPLLAGPSAPTVTCAPPARPARPIAWSRPWSAVACPVGQCEVLQPQLAAAPDGDLVAVAGVAYHLQYTTLEGGVALLRHTSSGELRAQALWDFTATPLRTAIARHPALLRDGDGQLLYASARAIWPGDPPRALTLAAFSAQDPTRTEPARFTSERTRPTLAAIGGNGDVLVASSHHAWDPAAPPSTSGALPTLDSLPSLTLFARDGHARWNRTWTEAHRGAEIVALHLDAAGRGTVLLRELHETRVLRLNPDGTLRWQRSVVADSVSSEAVVDSAGTVYVLTLRNTIARAFVAQVEMFDASGTSRHIWDLADAYGALRLQLLGSEQAVVSLRPASEGDRAVLRTATLGPQGACDSVEYAWPETLMGEASALTEPVALARSAQGAVYFASTQVVGRLGETP